MYPCCVITFWRPAFREGSHFLRFITFFGGQGITFLRAQTRRRSSTASWQDSPHLPGSCNSFKGSVMECSLKWLEGDISVYHLITPPVLVAFREDAIPTLYKVWPTTRTSQYEHITKVATLIMWNESNFSFVWFGQHLAERCEYWIVKAIRRSSKIIRRSSISIS